MNDAPQHRPASRRPAPAQAQVRLERNVEVPMRDGTILRADLWRPAAEGKYPVLLQRTPYNKELLPLTAMTLDPTRAAAAGYVVMIQDVRARWASDGDVFYLYRNERDDGFDTMEWAASQPWSSGQVGAYGVSYMAGTAWHCAGTGHSALKAISPTTGPNDFWEGHLWRGGALNWGLIVMWSLQAIGLSALARTKLGSPDFLGSFLGLVADIDEFESRVRHLPPKSFPPARPDDASFLPFFSEVIQHPVPDDWTRSMAIGKRHSEVRAPALIIGGWHDLLLDNDLQHFAAMRSSAATEEARKSTRLVIGPWSHGMFVSQVGDLEFGLRANGLSLDLREDLTGLQLRWFDRWLRDKRNGVDTEAPVRIFVQGENRWRDEQEWPLARAKATPLYLRANATASFKEPDAGEGADRYVYDPQDPCPTCGGQILMPSIYRRGPVDQAPILSRHDVLRYTSGPLADKLEVTGPVRCVLYAATNAIDTDWIVKLCDVHPDGRSFNVCDGVLRARYRGGFDAPALVEPGSVLRYEIALSATSMVFAPGHRLQVLVTSSDFPRYDRNPNTGAYGVDATTTRPAQQQIFHDAVHASHVVLPVIGKA